MLDQTFRFEPSYLYAVVLAVMIAASIFIAFMLPFPFWLQCLLTFLLVGYGAAIICQYALLVTDSSVIALKKLDQTHWQIEMPTRKLEGELLGESVMTGIVSVLRFKIKGRGTLVCIVWKSSLPRDLYRKLLVALKN